MTYHVLTMFEPSPSYAIEQQQPEALYAMCLWGEARGQSVQEKLAVASVILNRARRPYTPTGKPMWWMKAHNENLLARVKSVVLHPWQFSAFNLNDPNRAKLLAAPGTEPQAWEECTAVCAAVLDGLFADPTRQADHYHSFGLKDWAAGRWPSWAKLGTETATIGRFRFYRLA